MCLTFVDDMLSLLVYHTEDEVEVWATRVIECFEMFEMNANVIKLEIMVVPWCKGSKPSTRKVARGRLKFSVRGITIKATTSAKYLGTTRLSRNTWKLGALSERSKVKAFRTLVLPLLLHGTECILLTKQQENKLERWQTKQLWKIARSRSDYGKTRPASEELRDRCQCPTIVSVIRLRRLALWKSVLTRIERLNDDPTIACRKTSNSLSNTASLTRQHDALKCRRTSDSAYNLKRKTRRSTRLGTWTKWLERQPKEAFKSVRTYLSPVSDNHQVLVECPSFGQRVSGGLAKGPRKTQPREAARTDREDGMDLRSRPCCVHAQGCVEETHDESLCSHFWHEPSRHPELETPNVCERDEQERGKGRQGIARKGSRGRGAAGQDDRPPDATARIRAHGNGESRERRV